MMDQIVTLFEDFRENNLSYDDLYNTLLSKIQQDPSFRHQAIPTLDQVQQRTPIPITHFIQLRAELDGVVENFTPTGAQQTSTIPTDPDATLITPLPDSVRPNDTTDCCEDVTAPNLATGGLSATKHDITNEDFNASAQTLIAKPTTEAIDDADEATMIMPSGTLSGSLPISASTPSTIDSEDETVVNHTISTTSTTATSEQPLAETLVGQPYEPLNDENQAETLVGTPTNSSISTPHNNSETEPQPSTPELTASPKKSPSSTAWMLGGAATFIIISGTIAALTSDVFRASNNTDTASPKQTAPSSEQSDSSWGVSPGILNPVPETPSALQLGLTNTLDAPHTPSDTDTPDDNASPTAPLPTETLSHANEIVESATPISIDSQTAPPEETAKPTVIPVIKEKVFESKKDEISYLVAQITNAINAHNLAPADKLGTATYYLIKLIKASPNSPLVSQTRSRIAKAHLALAATAREGERWDEAQQHLDDAFTVRLPDSYQSE